VIQRGGHSALSSRENAHDSCESQHLVLLRDSAGIPTSRKAREVPRAWLLRQKSKSKSTSRAADRSVRSTRVPRALRHGDTFQRLHGTTEVVPFPKQPLRPRSLASAGGIPTSRKAREVGHPWASVVLLKSKSKATDRSVRSTRVPRAEN